jgi:hypothetical protein
MENPMNYSQKLLAASAIAAATSLGGCGGAGGGAAVAFIPAPTPTPTTGPTSVGAPTLAVVPNGSLFPIASVAGPTLRSQSTTTFPLLETVMKTDSTGAHADVTTTNAGATLAFGSTSDDYRISIANPALGISNQLLSRDICGFCSSADVGQVFLHIASPATSNLNWTSYGMWGVQANSAPASTTSAAFVTGYKTSDAAVPKSGTATFNGSVVGQVMYPQAGQENGVAYSDLTGKAALEANFASGAITGNLTNMMAGSNPWNSVSLAGSIATGQNYFSGSTAATSAPANETALSGSATGTFAGMFFGPSAQELGAVWTLSDGHGSAIGSIGATSDPSGAGAWDY